MPRAKKITVTDHVEIQPIVVPPEEDLSIGIPVPIADNKDIVKNEKKKKAIVKDIKPASQAPVTKLTKEQFKQLHIKDTSWLENDLYQTIEDVTAGKKSAKAFILNQALKDYFKKNKVEIRSFRVKEKKES